MSVRRVSFEDAHRADLLELVSRCAGARLPGATYLMTSDLAWRWPDLTPREDLGLWYDEQGLAGYVMFEPPTGLELDLRPDLSWEHPLGVEMLAWSEARRREIAPAYPRFVELESMDDWREAILNPVPVDTQEGRWLTAGAMAGDATRRAFLERNGFVESRHFSPHYRQSLEGGLPDPDLEPGAQLRHVLEADFAERIATHRDAWLRSQFDLDRYRAVRAAPNYDPQLDIVLEAPDGSFAGYCICWRDAALGIGSFEPVGTRPRSRGKGTGRQVIQEGLRRLRDRGMRWAQVETAGFNHAAQGLYTACGFQLVEHCTTFVKRVQSG